MKFIMLFSLLFCSTIVFAKAENCKQDCLNPERKLISEHLSSDESSFSESDVDTALERTEKTLDQISRDIAGEIVPE